MEKKIDNNKQTPKPRKNQPKKWNEKKKRKKATTEWSGRGKRKLGNGAWKLGKTR